MKLQRVLDTCRRHLTQPDIAYTVGTYILCSNFIYLLFVSYTPWISWIFCDNSCNYIHICNDIGEVNLLIKMPHQLTSELLDTMSKHLPMAADADEEWAIHDVFPESIEPVH